MIDWRADPHFQEKWSSVLRFPRVFDIADDAVFAYQRGLLEAMCWLDHSGRRSYEDALNDVADLIAFGDRGAAGTGEGAETEGVSAPEPLRIWVSEKPLYMPPVETGLRRVGRILTEFGFGVALIAGAVWIVLEMLR